MCFPSTFTSQVCFQCGPHLQLNKLSERGFHFRTAVANNAQDYISGTYLVYPKGAKNVEI